MNSEQFEILLELAKNPDTITIAKRSLSTKLNKTERAVANHIQTLKNNGHIKSIQQSKWHESIHDELLDRKKMQDVDNRIHYLVILRGKSLVNEVNQYLDQIVLKGDVLDVIEQTKIAKFLQTLVLNFGLSKLDDILNKQNPYDTPISYIAYCRLLQEISKHPTLYADIRKKLDSLLRKL